MQGNKKFYVVHRLHDPKININFQYREAEIALSYGFLYIWKLYKKVLNMKFESITCKPGFGFVIL